MTTLKEWDDHWQKVYDRAVSRGKTPNQAVHLANANIEKSLGERPPSTPVRRSAVAVDGLSGASGYPGVGVAQNRNRDAVTDQSSGLAS